MHVEFYLTIGQLPRECIENCSTGGQDAAPAVDHWRRELDFSVDRDRAIDCLDGYGAWDREELTADSDTDLAEKILWLACGTFREYIIEAEEAGIDPFGAPPSDFSPDCGSDIFCLE